MRASRSVLLALAIPAVGMAAFSCRSSSRDSDEAREGEKEKTPVKAQAEKLSSGPGSPRERTGRTPGGDRKADAAGTISDLRSEMLKASRALMDLNARAMSEDPELAALRKEISEKKKQLREAIDQSPEVVNLMAKIERQREEIRRLMGQRTTFMQRKSAAHTFSDDIAGLEAKISRARGELNGNTRLLLDLKSKVLAREPNLASLQKEIITKQRKLRMALGENPEAQSLTKKVQNLRLKMSRETRD